MAPKEGLQEDVSPFPAVSPNGHSLLSFVSLPLEKITVLKLPSGHTCRMSSLRGEGVPAIDTGLYYKNLPRSCEYGVKKLRYSAL